MDLAALKARLTDIEGALEHSPLVELCTFETPGGKLVLVVSDRLRRVCKKGKVWKSNRMLTALKNAHYGFDRSRPRSRGGADGVFLLDRGFHPANEMMKKLFDHFLDKPDPLVRDITALFGATEDQLVPVRVVSHHMRLLGVLIERSGACRLALVDYDDTDEPG